MADDYATFRVCLLLFCHRRRHVAWFIFKCQSSCWGAAVGVIGLAYLMNTLGSISDKLNWLVKIEPFYYTQGVQALTMHDITWWYPWVLVIAGQVLGTVGLIVFNKRDLPAV